MKIRSNRMAIWYVKVTNFNGCVKLPCIPAKSSSHGSSAARVATAFMSLDETCCDNETDLSYDEILLQKLKCCLAGVLPPPQLTYPQQNIEEIVQLFNGTEWKNYESSRTGCFHKKVNCDQVAGRERQWPDIQFSIFFDISYNINSVTEQVVDLCDKYRERYVGCETSSFVTANSPTKYSGKKKDRRKGRSPRRLTYLTQRRKIFSQSSLQEACKANSFGLTKKTILMPKSSQKSGAQRSLFLTSEESRNKRKSFGRSPSKLKAMEIKRSIWLQRKQPKSGSTPRKQTPKKLGTPKKLSTPCKTTPKKCGTPRKSTPRKNVTPRKQTPKRNRTPRKPATPKNRLTDYKNMNENGKRSFFEMNKSSRLSTSSDDSKSEVNKADLSDSQRRKLLWAVSAALKKAGICQGHTNFRTCGKRLFKVCKQEWMSCSLGKTMKQGISEYMLSLTSKHVNDVTKEVEQAKTENPDLFSQDSSSCDFF